MKKKKIWLIVTTIIVTISIGLMAVGIYFFKVACVPGKKNFIAANTTVVKKSDPLYQQKKWYFNAPKKIWYMRSADQNYRLDANYLPHKGAEKTVILLHGYMNNKNTMAPYASLFYHLGYNVLMPDARSQGNSAGKYIGYGWVEKADVKKWVNKVITKTGNKQKIVIMGVSMGGATAMMTSGEKLPSQVKAFVEDCGYSNVKAEIEHEAGDLYHMSAFPRFPLVEVVSGINRLLVGYYLNDGSALKQLAKNKRPMLFIHGKNDNFVPTKMVYENYHATQGAKRLWVVPGAAHAKSYATHPKAYQKHVEQFLSRYVQ